MDLTQVKEGEKYRVLEIQSGLMVFKKLDNLGIRKGVEIIKVSSQLAKGPVVVQIGNTQIAIGYGMAKKIIVELQS